MTNNEAREYVNGEISAFLFGMQELQQVYESSSSVFFSKKKIVVDREKFEQVLEMLKREEARILTARQEIVRDAKNEANRLIKEAEEKVRELIDDAAGTRRGRTQANLKGVMYSQMEGIYRSFIDDFQKIVDEFNENAFQIGEEMEGNLGELVQFREKYE